MTIREALAEGSSLLASSATGSAKIETPGLDAGLLLSHVLHTDRTQLIVRGKEPLSPESYSCFQELLRQRLEGECVAYILGQKEFHGLIFRVSPAVLVPRPDTETLVEAALEVLGKYQTGNEESEEKNAGPLRVLDLCTGSGAVAIALKHEMPELEMRASDISPQALTVARQNSAQLRTINSTEIHFIESDLFAGLGNNRFDLIVSNPPYVASGELETLAPEIQREPRIALNGGEDGLSLIRRIIGEAGNYLLPGGTLLMEAGPGQMDTIMEILKNNSFNECRTYNDLAGRRRVIGGSRSTTPQHE